MSTTIGQDVLNEMHDSGEHLPIREGQWRAKEQAVVRRGWSKDLELEVVERDKVYGRA